MSKEAFEKLMAPKPEPVQESSTLAKVLEQVIDGAGKVWDEASRHAEHGAAEIMSAAYTGNAYVPYGWTKDNQDVEAPKTPEVTQENDGHER
jgi:hypothetical protein